MSHHIYQTKAFILNTRDIGEANKLIAFFTEDLGLINASAQGVRLQKSKLKASLQELSFSKIAVVRGREVWRVTSADKLISLYDPRIPAPIRRTIVHIFAFLKRLLPLETKHDELFLSLSKFCAFCLDKGNAAPLQDGAALTRLELLAQIRILYELGYGSDEDFIKPFLNINEWSLELLNTVAMHEDSMVSHIDKALESSHL